MSQLLFHEDSGLWSVRAVILLLVAFVLLKVALPFRHGKPIAPIVGRRSRWEPNFWLRLRFTVQGREIIEAGYKKFRDTPFLALRNDVDLLVLPKHYLKEMRFLNRNKANALSAQVPNLLGKYTGIQLLLESDLHFNIIRRLLGKDLPETFARADEEIEFAWDLELPQSDEWTSVDIQSVFRRLSARLSGLAFIGRPHCRDDRWLSASIAYTTDLFTTAFFLRQFPAFLAPLLLYLIPHAYRINTHVNAMKTLALPLILARKRQIEAHGKDSVPRPLTVLEYLIDESEGREAKAERIVQRTTALTLGGVHTTAQTLSNALFDLIAHAEFQEELVEEIERVAAVSGGSGSGWTVQKLNQLHKLDSFLCEAARGKATQMTLPQRRTNVPLVFKDGFRVPANTHLTFPAISIMTDAEIWPEPARFDPWRNYRKRLPLIAVDNDAPAAKEKLRGGKGGGDEFAAQHAYTTPSEEFLLWGFGNQACPARFFAGASVKAVLVRVLVGYELRFERGNSECGLGGSGEGEGGEGKGRPGMVMVEENMFPDPKARVLIRRRRRRPGRMDSSPLLKK